MTGRQRLLAILNRQPIDRLAWGTLIDATSTSAMPEEVRRLHPLDFYRRIGCDLYTFGNYGLPREDCVPAPSRWVCPGCQEKWEQDGDRATLTRATRWGTLTATFDHWHPVKYPVTDVHEAQILRRMWEESDFVEDSPGPLEEAFARVDRKLGEDGLYLPTLEPSPVQRLIEYEMGMETFYYLLQDDPRQMRALLDAMHAKRLREYQIMARRTPAPAAIAVENTSSMLTSSEVYRDLTLPMVNDYADALHACGKKLILHMCGHLKALLPVLSQTRADAFNAPTPPPVGTTYVEDVLDACGEDFPIYGAIFSPEVFQKIDVTPREIHEALDRFYSPRVRRSHLLLWLGVDGLPTPLERFLAVGEWMQENGKV